MSFYQNKRQNPLKKNRNASTARTHAHADDWLMTYADMITLLLCFFAIFLSVSVPKKEMGGSPAKSEQIAASGSSEVFQGNLPFHTLLENKALRDKNDDRADVPDTTQASVIEMTRDNFFDPGTTDVTAAGEKAVQDMAAKLQSSTLEGYAVTVEMPDDMSGTPRVVIRLEKNAR